MDCEEIRELAGAYALKALPPEILQEVKAHLAGCTAHPDIADLEALAQSLAWTAPEKTPPAALKARLMTAIRGETTEERRTSWILAWPWPRLAPQALIAVLMVAVVGLLTWNIVLQISQDDGQGITFVRSMTDSGAASGRIIYMQEQGTALLIVEGLEPLPSDMTYQVWAIDESGPQGIGLFTTTPTAEGTIVLQVDLSRATSIAITIERAGGSLLPTSAPILSAEI